MLEEIVISYLPWLFGLAIAAGTIDAMAGGGGLLTVPALLATGISPIAALATNKLQGTFSSFSAMVYFWRKDKIRLQDHWLPACASFLGSLAGAAALSFMDPEILRKLIPFLLIAIAIWVYVSPQLGDVSRKARISFAMAALTFIPLIGFYDGFFGPGTGTFFALGGVALLGIRLDEATMRAKIYNVSSNLGALSFFLFSGHIVWVYGVVMAAGMMIGGNIGARLVLKHGTRLIRAVLVIVSLMMSAKLFFS